MSLCYCCNNFNEFNTSCKKNQHNFNSVLESDTNICGSFFEPKEENKTAREVVEAISQMLKENEYKIYCNPWDPSLQLVSNVQKENTKDESELFDDDYFEFD